MIDFRPEYRTLSALETARLEALKAAAEALDNVYEDVRLHGRGGEKARLLALARTSLETSVMYAVKAAT